MNLFSSYRFETENAYIIRVKGNEKSEKLAKQCADSCEKVKMPYRYWDAYDGMSGGVIKTPDHHNEIMNLIKITDHYLTRGEVACALSHISLWARCVLLDRPIVILEHDTLMVQPYLSHPVYNSIGYLGGNEQVLQGWGVYPTPPHASEGPNYHFICRAHAYAIDPAVAKNMLAYAIKYGITGPLDIMIRADLFPIHQMGVYAYDVYSSDDKHTETTILGRPREGRSTLRNDKLEI
jgi:GR25 family glycosyltransferase involved in LPS biosynthesis